MINLTIVPTTSIPTRCEQERKEKNSSDFIIAIDRQFKLMELPTELQQNVANFLDIRDYYRLMKTTRKLLFLGLPDSINCYTLEQPLSEMILREVVEVRKFRSITYPKYIIAKSIVTCVPLVGWVPDGCVGEPASKRADDYQWNLPTFNKERNTALIKREVLQQKIKFVELSNRLNQNKIKSIVIACIGTLLLAFVPGVFTEGNMGPSIGGVYIIAGFFFFANFLKWEAADEQLKANGEELNALIAVPLPPRKLF